MTAISGEPDGVRSQPRSAVPQLTARDWGVVAAGAVAVIGAFLPWYGFSLPSVSYSVSGFTTHGPVPMAPLTLVPALSGLVAAGQRLLPLVRNASGGAPAGSKKSVKKKEPWWPQPVPPADDPSDQPLIIPPPIWRNPVLQAWALLTMILYLFVDTSEAGHRSGYWLTFVATILIPVLDGRGDAPTTDQPEPLADPVDQAPDPSVGDGGDGEPGDGQLGDGEPGDGDGQKGLTRDYGDPVEPGDGPPDGNNDGPPVDTGDPPEQPPPDDPGDPPKPPSDGQGPGKTGGKGGGKLSGGSGGGSGGKGKAGGGAFSGVLPAVVPADRGVLAELLRHSALPSAAFVRAFLRPDPPVAH